jgi:hypothetical protein
MSDIFDFWAAVRPSDCVHPADDEVLQSAGHRGFNLKCLPVPYYGPLKTAKVVLLYLAPGLLDQDIKDARSPRKRELMHLRLQGDVPLSGHDPHSWWITRTKCFGLSAKLLGSKLAVLEICPYHSKTFRDWPLLAALPSCRIAVNWAQEVLFPRARKGEKVVICMRAAKYWGLTPGRRNDGLLFSPKTTRSGHMRKAPMRAKIIGVVRNILSEGQ